MRLVFFTISLMGGRPGPKRSLIKASVAGSVIYLERDDKESENHKLPQM